MEEDTGKNPDKSNILNTYTNNNDVVSVSVTENELYVSKDKGNTWTSYSSTTNNNDVVSVSVTENELYVSKDKGNTWTSYSSTENVDESISCMKDEDTSLTNHNTTKNIGDPQMKKEDIKKAVKEDKLLITSVYTNNNVVYACSTNMGLLVSKNYAAGNVVVWVRYSPTGEQGKSMATGNTRDVCVDDKGHIYLATDEGISISRDSGVTWNNYNILGASDGISKIAVGDGSIYAGTTDNGMYRLDSASCVVVKHEKTEYSNIKNIRSIFVSRLNPPMHLHTKTVYISSGYFANEDNEGEQKFITKISFCQAIKWVEIRYRGYDANGNTALAQKMDVPASEFASMVLGSGKEAREYVYAALDDSCDDHSLHVINQSRDDTGACPYAARLDAPFGVSTVACSSNFIYAGSSDNDGKIAVGEVHDNYGNISWTTQADITSSNGNPQHSKKIIAMAACFSGSVVFALSDDNRLYASVDSGVTWDVNFK